MNRITKHSARDLAYRLIGSEYLPPDEDECALRDAQRGQHGTYRSLRSSEIDQLAQNGNSATDWGTVLVSERFNPKLVRDCRFCGLVRIGDLENLVLDFAGMRLPVGLYHSTVISCDIGNNVAIDRAFYLAHTIVGDEVLIHNLGQMLTTPKAHFGQGGLAEDENEDDRAWIEVGNENGRRGILPFAGILPADAWLWSKYRHEPELMERFKQLTDAQTDRRGGRYSRIGDRTVIRNCRSIVDVQIGTDAELDGAERLANLTIRSDAQEGTRIGEGVELADGIVGYGCEVGSGSKAFHFILGTKARLHYGARLVHSFLGDNSTVSCCEVLNSLLFPNHEQHHNNSFLIAVTAQGQSNIAAGATIGSNHNSRGLDGEILAARGFWPGLCTNYKHPCRFASFALIAKGNYPYELYLQLPFSLLATNETETALNVIPAYGFLYNMYAAVRNAWKFRARDRRLHQEQHLEFDYLAPDTIEEIFVALELLETWTAKAWLREQGKASEEVLDEELRAMGRDLLLDKPELLSELEILGEGIENSKRKVRVLKAGAAYAIYREMAHYGAVKALLGLMETGDIETVGELAGQPGGERERQWVNLGGQLVAGSDLARLKQKIVTGEIDSWTAVHEEYDALWAQYPLARGRHALAALLALHGLKAAELDAGRWAEWLRQAAAIQEKIARLTLESRAKDHTNPFRQITFESREEMNAVMGTIEENAFIRQAREEADAFGLQVAAYLERDQPAASGRKS